MKKNNAKISIVLNDGTKQEFQKATLSFDDKLIYITIGSQYYVYSWFNVKRLCFNEAAND